MIILSIIGFFLNTPFKSYASIKKDYLQALVISSYSKDIPAQSLFESGLNKVLEFKRGKHNIFFEFMDISRLKPANIENYTNYIKKKYNGMEFDFVIGWASAAIDLLISNTDLFEQAERVYIEVDQDIILKEREHLKNIYVIGAMLDYRASVDRKVL